MIKAPLNKFILIFISLFSMIQTNAGGSFVGNGSGLVENNFQFAYSSLNTIFSNCLASLNCGLEQSELKIIERIHNVIQLNIDKSDRIQFVSEKKYPGYFTTGETESHRIAKTGLSALIPIFVNSDRLYDENGGPAIDFPTIISILTHELGHQSGEVDHARLDILGTKIKNLILQQVTKQNLKLGNNQGDVEVMILTTDYPLKGSDIFFSWTGVGSISLAPALLEFSGCPNPNATLSGYEITNSHFIATNRLDTELPSVEFGLWVDLHCYTTIDHKNQLERKSINLEISKDLKVKMIQKTRVKTVY